MIIMIENCTIEELLLDKSQIQSPRNRGEGKVRAWTTHWKASPDLRRARGPAQHRSLGCTTEIFS